MDGSIYRWIFMANKRGFLQSIKQRDPAAKSYLQILIFYPGVHALFNYRLSRFFYVIKLTWISYFISNLARFFTGIEIHPGAKIGKRLFIDHGMGVVIGETTVIGDDVTMYHGVTLGSKLSHELKRHPLISDGVVIGAYATILGHIRIGKNAIIGTHSVVLKEVEDNGRVSAASIYK